MPCIAQRSREKEILSSKKMVTLDDALRTLAPRLA